MSDRTLNEIMGTIKFPTGMSKAPFAKLTDLLMRQDADNLGADPETITIQQIADLIGAGSGGGEGNPSTDPVFNTVNVIKSLTIGGSGMNGQLILDDVLFKVFREGIRTYIRISDQAMADNPDNEMWLDIFAAIFTKMICNSLKTDNFQQGISGGAFYKDEMGNSHLEVDYGVFRKKATFTTLVIQELQHQAGQVILTPVNMTIDRVVEKDTGWECYPEPGKTVNFIKYDQARCQKFEIGYSKYYWRLVEEVTSEYAFLSKTDYDGTDAPEPGDEIVLFGHRNDANPSRQCAILLDSASDFAPAIQMFSRLGSAPNPYDMYGKMAGYFGRDTRDPSSCVIVCNGGRFDNIAIGPGCTGLDNFKEYDKLLNDVNNAVSKSVDVMPDPSPAFITDQEGVTTPDEITIRTSENGFNSDLGGLRKWYYLTQDGFVEIEGENNKTLVIRKDSPYWNNKTTLSIMYEVEMEDSKFSDVTALIKVSDGLNGVGSYMAVLDNPYVGVSTDYTGVIKDGQLGVNGRVKTSVIAYQGVNLLSYAPNPGKGQYNFKIKSQSGCEAAISASGLDMYVETFYSDLGKVVLEVNFEGKQTMDLVFNCGKTYDGALSSEEIKGEPGDPAYSMDLDNDSIVVATQPDGSGGYWEENTISTATVYKGGQDISNKYIFAVSGQPDTINFLATNANRTVQVKGMETDDGYILFVAIPRSTSDPDTYNAPTLQKRLNITKSKQGFQGIQGPGGYIWIVYADDEVGTGITLNPAGKKYIGIAYGKEVPSPTPPLKPEDYKFSLLTGEGVPGPPGSSLYTWIKFATRYPITNLNQVTNDGQAEGVKYMLLAYNQVNEVEDTFPEGEEHEINVNYYNTYYIATEYRGDDGASLMVQYSSNAISWHDVFQVGDIWMRQMLSDGLTWSEPMRIVGEDGSDGQYTNYQFSKNTSMETPPTSNWQDGPPPISGNEFLWMRKGVVIPPALEPTEWSTPVVLSGPPGASYWIVPGTNFVNLLQGSPNPDIVRFTAKRGSVSDGVTGWSLGFWRTYYSRDNQKSWTNIESTSQLPWVEVKNIQASWTNIKAELYFDKGYTELCDSEVILVQDVSGIPGKSNYYADLSNELGSTNVDEDGYGGYWGDNMKTTLNIFYGTENVTRLFNITVEASEGSGIRFTKSVASDGSVTVQVNAMPLANTGYVTFTCVPQAGLDGAVTITKMFQIVKIPKGETGEKGDVSTVVFQYAASASGPWHDTFQTNDIYLREVIDGVAGKAMLFVGEDGKPGAKGEDGSYVEFQFAISASNTTPPAAGSSDWKDGAQLTTDAKPYQWMRKRTVQGDGTTGSWSYSLITIPGEDGPAGADGAAYWMTLSTSQISIKDGKYNPSTITMESWKGMSGTGMEPYAVYYEVWYSTDYMESFFSLDTTNKNAVTSITKTLENKAGKPLTNLKFKIFFDSAKTKLIDTEVVPIINNDLNDITSLDYIKYALKQMTTIQGGLVSSTMISLGYSPTLASSPSPSVGTELPSDWKETAGVYGGSTLVPNQSSSLTRTRFRNKCPRFYSGTNIDDTNSEHTAFWYAQQALDTAATKLGLDVDTYNPDKCTFAVSDSGILYAKNCYIEGNIVSDEGRIGSLTLKNGNLSNDNFIINSDGTVEFKGGQFGPFRITSDKLYYGTISSTQIGLEITSRQIKKSGAVSFDGLFVATVNGGIMSCHGFKANMSSADKGCFGFYCDGASYFASASYGVYKGNSIPGNIKGYKFLLLYSSSDRTMSLSGVEGMDQQHLYIVNCDASNHNIYLNGVYQYNANGGLEEWKLKMDDGGSHIEVVYISGNWLFVGRSGSARTA